MTSRVTTGTIKCITSARNLVTCVMGLNPGLMTLHGTNTYLVGTGRSRLLIDTGAGVPAYCTQLLQVMHNLEVDTIAAVLLTHHHPDHVGGIPALRSMFGFRLPVYKFPDASTDERLKLKDISPLTDGQEFHIEGATVRVFHTPGHTDDSVTFLLKEKNAIFTGDTVLGHGSTVFRNLATYMSSLERMLKLQPSRLYPAHGPTIDGADAIAHIQAYITHRLAREYQILKSLNDFGPQSAMQMVKRIYAKTPVELHAAAFGNVVLHLEKLLADQRVQISMIHTEALQTISIARDSETAMSQNHMQTLSEIIWNLPLSVDKLETLRTGVDKRIGEISCPTVSSRL